MSNDFIWRAHGSSQAERDLLVDLAFRWADVEHEVQVLKPDLARALSEALRVEVLVDEYDLDAGLTVGDAMMAASDEGAAYTPTKTELIGTYYVDFPLTERGHAAAQTVSDAVFMDLIQRYAVGAMDEPVARVVPPGHAVRGQVCRRPPALRGERQKRVPKVRRGAHLLTPIEAKFYDELAETGLTFAAQVVVEGDRRFVPDFVVFAPGGIFAVEIDGHEAHASREQRTRDAEKDRWLMDRGFRTVRFTGSEVHRDAIACVRELVKLTRQKGSTGTP